MSTPFYFVDHRIGPREPLPYEDRPPVRRGAPAVLRLTPTVSGPADSHLSVEPLVDPDGAPSASSAAGWLARLFRGLHHARA